MRDGRDLMTAAHTNITTIFPSAELYATAGVNKIPNLIMNPIVQQTVEGRKGVSNFIDYGPHLLRLSSIVFSRSNQRQGFIHIEEDQIFGLSALFVRRVAFSPQLV